MTQTILTGMKQATKQMSDPAKLRLAENLGLTRLPPSPGWELVAEAFSWDNAQVIEPLFGKEAVMGRGKYKRDFKVNWDCNFITTGVNKPVLKVIYPNSFYALIVWRQGDPSPQVAKMLDFYDQLYPEGVRLLYGTMEEYSYIWNNWESQNIKQLGWQLPVNSIIFLNCEPSELTDWIRAMRSNSETSVSWQGFDL